MEFGWLNLCNAMILALMMIPNIWYACKNPEQENHCGKPWLWLEGVGRYGSMALMIFPLGVWEFGFCASWLLPVYFIGNALLMMGYYFFWAKYSRKRTMGRAMALAMLPTGIFLLCGITLGHGLLTCAAAVFGVGHGAVTRINHLRLEKT